MSPPQAALRRPPRRPAPHLRDQGPGIADIPQALKDGYTTGSGLGLGLGGARRLMDEFSIASTFGLPKPRETVSGDAWDVQDRGDGARVLVVDGLGHGPDAHRAARQAVIAAARERGAPGPVVETCHASLRRTRGAALAVADIDVEQRRVWFAGTGNGTGTVLGGARRQNLVSMNGTAGQGVLRTRQFEYGWERGSLLVMATDGLATRWALEDYPGLAARHPALVAAIFYRDHTRGSDDVTVLAVRERPEAPGVGG